MMRPPTPDAPLKFRLNVTAVAAGLAVAALSAWSQQVPPGVDKPAEKLVTREIFLATGVSSLTVTEDCQRAAWVVSKNHKSWVVVNGVPQAKQYDGIEDYSLTFTPDGKRLAFRAKRGKERFVVLDDGVEGRPYDRIEEELAFSPDGKRLAYRAKRGDQRFVVLDDGAESKPYKNVGNVGFSPDSKRLAYVAVGDQGAHVVVDGQEGPSFDSSSGDVMGTFQTLREHNSVFSPDSKRVGYWARRARKWLSVVDGKEYADASPPRFSPDGLRLAYVNAAAPPGASKRGSQWLSLSSFQLGPYVIPTWNFKSPAGYKWSVMVDGQAVKEHSQPISPFIAFSPDGKRLAYCLVSGPTERVVVDGVEGKEYEKVDNPTFSPDGRRVAYRAKRGGKWMLVLDGVESQPYDDLGSREWGTPYYLQGVSWSPDSKRLAVAAKRAGKWRVVVDGVEGQPHGLIETIVWSPDSKRLAYVAGREASFWTNVGTPPKWFVVVDGVEYTGIKHGQVSPPIFSPDSRHVAYKVDKRIVMDGRVSGEHLDTELGPLIFANGLLRTVAFRGAELVRVEVDCPPARP